MKKIFKFLSPISVYLIFSSSAFAATCSLSNARSFKGLVTTVISCFLNPIVTLMVSGSIVLFLWGVFKFIRAEGEDKQAGREFMFWGIVGLFVMVSLWGLVNILQNTLRI